MSECGREGERAPNRTDDISYQIHNNKHDVIIAVLTNVNTKHHIVIDVCVRYWTFGVLLFFSLVCSLVRSFFLPFNVVLRTTTTTAFDYFTSNTTPYRSTIRITVCINIMCVSRPVHSFVRAFVDLFGVLPSWNKPNREYLSTMCALVSISGWTVNEWQSRCARHNSYTEHIRSYNRQSILNKFT